MAPAADKPNPLLSLQTSSESGLQAILHPLVLLTISDYITRHTLRKQPAPIVGALLGQQNGRHITIEHAFECATVTQGGKATLEPAWFAGRLDQMRQIHSSPQLDLVGWYTVLPRSGPIPDILPIHNWLMSEHNESSLLLAFHPEEALDHSAGSRLPLTIYESLYEADDKAALDKNASQDEDKEMRDREAPLELRFRELPYSVETGEAEMISMDFVARGAGNATMVEPRQQKAPSADAKGKGKAKTNEEPSPVADNVLSTEEEEMIGALTAKTNAVKMLQSRINLLIAYLERLPPSYLSNDSTASEQTSDKEPIAPSHTILRSINGLVNRLPLLVPADLAAFQREVLSEANDVRLVGLLNDIMQSVTEVRDVGKKYGVVETAKNYQKKHMDLREATGIDRGFMMNTGDLNI